MKSWKILAMTLCLSVGIAAGASLQVSAGDNHGEYQDADARLQDMERMAEQDGYRLYLDQSDGEFAVEDVQTGAVWFSNPYDAKLDAKSNDDTKQLLQSYLRLTYYDQSQKSYEMNSWKDCMSKNQFTVEPIDGGFRLNMQIGEADSQSLVPQAAEAANFEEKVLASLTDKQLRKIKSYYTKISISDPKLLDTARKAYLESYPGLEEHDFYILRSVVDREKREIENILITTEYGEEDLTRDIELSGYESGESSKILIEMALEVTLDHGNLLVRIPGDSIQYDDVSYILGSITILEYFGAAKSEEDGYLMIPDGSGSLIYYNTDSTKKILYTQKPVYGMDYALLSNYAYNSLTKQVHLPVFGNKTGEQAFLAIMETGEAMATITCESGNILSSYETVYPVYNYVTANTVSYDDSSKLKGQYTYYDVKPYDGDYTLRYCLLSGENADYVGMANVYREYLLDKGVIQKESLQDDGAAPVYVEVLGTVDKQESFLGIPYTTYTELTTFEQAKQLITELSEGGIDGLKLRYTGWANNGLYYEVSNHVDVAKALGGTKKLQELLSYAGQQGVEVFPDVDFTTVREDKKFDGYSSSRNSVDSLQREELYLVSPKEISSLNFLPYAFYSVSPSWWSDYMSKYFKDYNKLGLDNVSIGTFGNMLYGDYNRKASVNREEVKSILCENMQNLTSGKKVMTEGGNLYMLPYVTDIVDMSLGDSSYTNEDEAVPFMQLVLHGSVEYSSPALNLEDDIQNMFLKCIEYGASPYFTVVYDNGDELKNTVYTLYYSVDYPTWQQSILQYGNAFEEAYAGLAGQVMVNHEKLQEGVYRTTYENGTSFLVNYNDRAVTVEGQNVPAKNYIKLAH